jgi:hypothetical protein
MGRARGLLLAGVTVVLLEATTGAVGVIMLGPVEIAVYLLVCAAATAGVTALAVRLIGLRGDRGEGDDGGGGWGDGGPDEPPPWWPDFERDFRRYARERECDRKPTRA